jgi:hypothetical protein
MLDAEWIRQRRTELQRDMQAALRQVEQLRGALAMLDEVEGACIVAAEGNGADPTPS